MEILDAFKDMELTDEQVESLDKFFAGYTENIKTEISEEYKEKIETLETKVSELSESEGLYSKENVEKAFALFQEDAGKAFELLKEDAAKAAETMVEDVRTEFTESMAEALHSVYEDVEERVKADFFESREFKALESIKEAVAPILIGTDSEHLLEEIESLRAEKRQLEETTTQLTRKEIISTLLEDLPEKYVETVFEFISTAKTDEEIYERFNTIVSIIEKKEEKEDDEEDEEDSESDKKDSKSKKDDEDEESEDEEDEEEDDKDDDKKDEKKKDKKSTDEGVMFESSTTTDEEDNEGLTASEREMLKMIGLL